VRKIVEKSMLGRAWIASDDGDVLFAGEKDLLKRILLNRGIQPENMDAFLNPSVHDYMPDPFVLKDMESAVKLIADAILKKEKIAIYGDYDVDGITSTAIFVKYLQLIDVDVIWHLPTREGEGYGLNPDAVNDIYNQGVKLLITVDCGISGAKEVEIAKNLGMNVVVTDHHSVDAILPRADAVVNPKRADDTSDLKYLAGVGVAFLTLVALNRELKNSVDTEISKRAKEVNLLNLMDCVALGTVCDTMPLIGLNRAFVTTGLKVLGLRQNLGLKVLMDVAKLDKVSVYGLGFVLGPRLNAAGRLDSAGPALDLLLADNPLVAYDLATKLDAMNQQRIDIQNAIMLRASELAEDCCRRGKCSLFVCGDDWHGGVMGIIAGRLKDRYNLPTCVATRVDGVINGSGRSVAGVDLGAIIHDALTKGLISEGGGHAAAAGFSLKADKENEFCEFLEKSVLEQLGGQKPLPDVMVDAELDASGATIKLVDSLKQMEPFGQANPEPVLVLYGCGLKFANVMGKTHMHLRGALRTSSGKGLDFVGFNLVGTPVGDFLLDTANLNTKIKVLGRLKENDYSGRVQFVLEDVAL